MKFDCGHEGCDLCGTRTCENRALKVVGQFRVCDTCLVSAVETVVRFAAKWSAFFDTSSPCQLTSRKK